MLKLPKALKKKKKGKKHKKDQELFTEEELAEYKKQLQLKQQQEQQQDQEQQDQNQQQETNQEREGESDETYDDNVATEQERRKSSDKTSKEEDEEWLKFKNLTAGVDSLLHKTQDDLSRIKSTSFFQRVPPSSEREKEEKEKALAAEEEEKKNKSEQEQKESPEHDKLAEAVVDLSDLDDDSDESEDDIFDTAYIDAITSGEVQLAVVPDSPVLEINEGPDPFDTSYADKLIKGPEVSKRGKKIVNIGPAVEVLTGRLDSAQAVSVSGAKRKPRRGIQNLLLDDFDDEQTAVNASQVSSSVEAASVSEAAAPKSLLDDPADEIPADVPVDLSVSLHLQLLKNKDTDKPNGELENSTEDTVGVVDEQNDDNQGDNFEENQQEEDDEFAALAAESLTKKEVTTVVIKPTEPTELIVQSEVSGDWAHFEQQPQEEVEEQQSDAKEKPKEKVKPQRPPKPAILAEQLKNDDSFEFDDIADDDPFDTAFVEKVIDTQQAVESKRISITDNNLLTEENSSFITVNSNNVATSIANTQVNVIERQIDDLFDLGEEDIALPEPLTEASVLPPPITTSLSAAAADFDPFDTSTVEGLVQPKSTELKFLEEELLTDLKHSLSDPDFDPRAIESGEKSLQIEVTAQVSSTVSVTPYADAARRKSSLSLHLESTKSVAFLVPETKDESGKVHKPLTPYCTTVPEKDIPLDEDIDPFDTSFVIHCDTDDLSDSEFDPRADEKFEAQIIDNNPDFLTASTEDQINIKVLTPAQEFDLNKGKVSEDSELKEEFIDPFDTSTIAANILPGKTELKFIENELLPSAPSQSEVTEAVLDTQSDVQELGIGDKVLTPAQVKSNNNIEETLEDIDPFDTSFAENLKPGQAELKVLETEFI